MGKQNHMKDHERNNFENTFREYGSNYYLMLDDPMDKEGMLQFILDMLPESHARAWRVLSETPALLQFTDSVSCILDDDYKTTEGDTGQLVLTMTDTNWEFPNIRGTPLLAPKDHELYPKVLKFAKEYIERRKKAAKVDRFVSNVLRYCNTPGQIVRVWPESIDFMSDRSKNVLGTLERKARVPKGIDVMSREWILKKDEVNNLIPLMMLAPEINSVPDHEFRADVIYSR